MLHLLFSLFTTCHPLLYFIISMVCAALFFSLIHTVLFLYRFPSIVGRFHFQAPRTLASEYCTLLTKFDFYTCLINVALYQSASPFFVKLCILYTFILNLYYQIFESFQYSFSFFLHCFIHSFLPTIHYLLSVSFFYLLDF